MATKRPVAVATRTSPMAPASAEGSPMPLVPEGLECAHHTEHGPGQTDHRGNHANKVEVINPRVHRGYFLGHHVFHRLFRNLLPLAKHAQARPYDIGQKARLRAAGLKGGVVVAGAELGAKVVHNIRRA